MKDANSRTVLMLVVALFVPVVWRLLDPIDPGRRPFSTHSFDAEHADTATAHAETSTRPPSVPSVAASVFPVF